METKFNPQRVMLKVLPKVPVPSSGERLPSEERAEELGGYPEAPGIVWADDCAKEGAENVSSVTIPKSWKDLFM